MYTKEEQLYKRPKGFQKGDLNPSRGIERRKQISLERKGKPIPIKQRKKISRSMKKALKNPELRKKWVENGKRRGIPKEQQEKMARAKKPKELGISALKRKADKIFSRYIRLRDSFEGDGGRYGYCITCEGIVGTEGRRAGQAGHFISRKYGATRYDERNVHLQCARCNMWGGGEQYKHSLMVDKLHGEGTADELFRLGHEFHRFTSDELLGIIEDYKLLIKTNYPNYINK